MKRILYLLILFCVISLSTIAQQQFFYNSEGEKIYLEKVDSLVFIKFDSPILQNKNVKYTRSSSAINPVVRARHLGF